MATPPSDESKLLFKLLIDRDWHSYEEVKAQIARTVPPGRALRKYRTDFNSYASKLPGGRNTNYEGSKSEDEKIQIGKNSVAGTTISAWKRSGALIERGERKGRQIRVRKGWTSFQFPGYEQEIEQDPPSEALGYTDPPPGDSVPSEGNRSLLESSPGSDPVVGGESEGFIRRAEEWAAARVGSPVEVLHVQQVGDREWQVVDPPAVHPVSPEGGLLAAPESAQHCELCGLVVGDKGVHAKWHEQQAQADTPPEMALLNETQLRVVVRSELATVLDQFQVGMQNHIDVGFAQMEAMIGAVGRLRERWTKMDGGTLK